MADTDRKLAHGKTRIDFQTDPSQYRHWKLAVDGDVATLTMDVDEKGGLFEGYDLKLNSYDLGVDIELHDAVNRIRFEHPEVKCVVMTSGNDRAFCSGADVGTMTGLDVLSGRQRIQRAHRVIAGLANLDKPVIAAGGMTIGFGAAGEHEMIRPCA